MGPVENEYEKIEAYLLGKLSAADRSDVESRMARDEAFRLRVAIHKEAHSVLGDEEASKFRNVLRDVHKEFSGKESNRAEAKTIPIHKAARSWRRVLAIAASIAVVLVAGYWTIGTSDPQSAQALAIAYTQPYELPGAFRGENELLASQALEAYEQEEYALAYERYSELALQAPSNRLHAFAAGVSALLSGQPQKAEAALEPIAKSNDLLLAQQARWYWGLSLLSQDRIEDARSVLNDIAEEDYQFSQAQSLLKELE